MTTSYICDYKGNVICQSGWKQSSDPEEAKSNPCSVPICNHDNETCAHGICRAPNFCACEVGWEGINCGVCIPLPGCVHGNCTMELECNCYEGWTGSKCDIRKLEIIIFVPPSHNGQRTFQPLTFEPQASTRRLSIQDFSTMNSSTPDFSIMNFSTMHF